nr:MAG TPA: hypothetical protein [Caudoviricetes sp.]
MHPGQHPQQTDEGGDGQHPDADGGVEVEPHHPKDGGAQSVAGGAGIAAGALRDEGDKARLLIRAGKVESGPQEGAHPERQPRHKDGPGDDLHKIKSAAAPPDTEHRKPPEVEQQKERRIADEGHEGEPAVEQDDALPEGGMPLEPVGQLLVSFRCHGASSLRRSVKAGVEVVFHIERLRRGVLAQVEGVMGVALLAAGAEGHPRDVALPRQGHHLPHQAGQIGPLFDEGAPCSPHGGLGLGQHGPQPAEVLVAEGAVGGLVHVVGVRGPLGVDVEHDPAVEAVGTGQTLHALQGGVQRAGLGGAGVDADADQRAAAHPAQHIAVRLVGVRLVVPDAAGVFAGFQPGESVTKHRLPRKKWMFPLSYLKICGKATPCGEKVSHIFDFHAILIL